MIFVFFSLFIRWFRNKRQSWKPNEYLIGDFYFVLRVQDDKWKRKETAKENAIIFGFIAVGRFWLSKCVIRATNEKKNWEIFCRMRKVFCWIYTLFPRALSMWSRTTQCPILYYFYYCNSFSASFSFLLLLLLFVDFTLHPENENQWKKMNFKKKKHPAEQLWKNKIKINSYFVCVCVVFSLIYFGHF